MALGHQERRGGSGEQTGNIGSFAPGAVGKQTGGDG